jgi:hypothetical protein
MTYFGSYFETPGMGLRESVNALLDGVAYTGLDFGYLAPAWAEANYRAISNDYSQLVVKSEGQLRLVSHVNDSAALAEMIDALVVAANDYPIISDEYYDEVVQERQLESISDALSDDGETRVTAEEVLQAAYDACDTLPAEDGSGEYGFYWLRGDYERALAAALEAKATAA